jgi:hypothetical protein
LTIIIKNLGTQRLGIFLIRYAVTETGFKETISVQRLIQGVRAQFSILSGLVRHILVCTMMFPGYLYSENEHACTNYQSMQLDI